MRPAIESRSTKRLVDQNMDLVRRIARALIRRIPPYMSREDMVQAGVVGLLEAHRNYDPTFGASFDTYAGIRIRGAILDEIRRQNWSPRSVHKNLRKVDAAVQSVESRAGRPAAAAEIAEEMGTDLATYHAILRHMAQSRVLSVEDVSGTELSDEASLESDVTDPATEYESYRLDRAVGRAMQTLGERERMVLTLYYGKELNLREIGEILGVTDARIHQIRKRAIASLRSRLRYWNSDRV